MALVPPESFHAMAGLPRVPIRQMRRLSERVPSGTDIQHSIAGMNIELHALVLIRSRVERFGVSTLQLRNEKAFLRLDTDHQRLTKQLRGGLIRRWLVFEVEFQEPPQPAVADFSWGTEKRLADETVVTPISPASQMSTHWSPFLMVTASYSRVLGGEHIFPIFAHCVEITR